LECGARDKGTGTVSIDVICSRPLNLWGSVDRISAIFAEQYSCMDGRSSSMCWPIAGGRRCDQYDAL